MRRAARRFFVGTSPPLSSSNVLKPFLFWAKRFVEGNTRPYFCYWGRSLMSYLRIVGFEPLSTYREFALPMGMHRALRWASLSRHIESALRSTGITDLIGSPALLMAERKGMHSLDSRGGNP